MTAPHSDCCPICWATLPRTRWDRWLALRTYTARSEEPDPAGDGYYVAAYRCTKGHTWRTTWAPETRLEPAALAAHVRLANLSIARHLRRRAVAR